MLARVNITSPIDSARRDLDPKFGLSALRHVLNVEALRGQPALQHDCRDLGDPVSGTNPTRLVRDDADTTPMRSRDECVLVPVNPNRVRRKRAGLWPGSDRGGDRGGLTAVATGAQGADAGNRQNSERDHAKPQHNLTL